MLRIVPKRSQLYVPKIFKMANNWSKKLLKHFTNTGQLSNLDLFPDKFKKAIPRNPYLYVANNNTAQLIAQAIQPHYMKMVPFFEIDPGPCILTKAFLQHLKPTTFTLINRAKTNDDFTHMQEKLVKLHQSQMLLKEQTYDWTKHILENSIKQQWCENIVGQLYVNLKSGRFLNYLIKDIVSERKFFKNGRIEIFAMMPTLEYMKLSAKTECTYLLYTDNSCMFQILFEYEVLAEVSKLDFLPWYMSRKKFSDTINYDQNALCLVRIVPKKNLYSTFQPDELPLFKYFVYQCFFKRHGRILPRLEKWIPGIGIKITNSKEITSLLATNSGEHFNMYTTSGLLTPNQILLLFKFFQTLPEYKTSNFHRQCHDFHAKNRQEIEEK